MVDGLFGGFPITPTQAGILGLGTDATPTQQDIGRVRQVNQPIPREPQLAQALPETTQTQELPLPTPDQARQRRTGLEAFSFERNPLGAIALVLDAVIAQEQGRTPAFTQLQSAEIQRRKLDIQEKSTNLKFAGESMEVLERGINLLAETPLDQQEALISQLEQTVQIPGFNVGETLREFSKGQLEGLEQDIQAVKDDPFLGAMLAGVAQGRRISPKQFQNLLKQGRKAKIDITKKVFEERALGEIISAEARERLDIRKQELIVKKERNEISKLNADLIKEQNIQKKEKLRLEIQEKERNIEQAEQDKQKGIDAGLDQYELNLQNIDEMLLGTGLEQASGVQAALPTSPGSPAATFESQLRTLKSAIFSDRIKQMVGLGQLSDAEGSKIESQIKALDIEMEDKVLRKNIGQIRDLMEIGRRSFIKRMKISPELLSERERIRTEVREERERRALPAEQPVTQELIPGAAQPTPGVIDFGQLPP